MNTNLFNALSQISSNYGGVATLSDARRVKALLADLAAGEPKPQKNALIACIEHGFVPLLRNIAVAACAEARAKMVERLNHEEGLEKALCADALDLLEAALCGDVSPKLEPPLTPAATSPAPPQPQAPLPMGLEYRVNDNGESVIITGYTGSVASIAIPACIQGLPVSAIGVWVFAW